MKKKMQGILLTAIAIAVCAAIIKMAMDIIFVNPSEVEPEFVLRYGEVNSTGHIMSDTAYYFADCVKELSEGKVVVEIYPSGQMGDDAQCYQAMRMGALDIYRGNSASMTTDQPSMISVMSLPYLFDGSAHFWEVCSSDLGNQMLLDIQENSEGIRGLVFLDEGARSFMTTDAPITKLEDMKGLKVRTLSSDIMLDTVRALGAEAVSLEYVELYSALKGKKIDGAENPLISYYYNKFYEVAPYYVKDEHTYSPSVMLISEITWQALGEQYQKVIEKAAKMAQDYNKKEMEATEQEVEALIKEKGIELIELEDIARWREAVKPLYDQYGAQYTSIIEQIRNMKR